MSTRHLTQHTGSTVCCSGYPRPRPKPEESAPRYPCSPNGSGDVCTALFWERRRRPANLTIAHICDQYAIEPSNALPLCVVGILCRIHVMRRAAQFNIGWERIPIQFGFVNPVSYRERKTNKHSCGDMVVMEPERIDVGLVNVVAAEQKLMYIAADPAAPYNRRALRLRGGVKVKSAVSLVVSSTRPVAVQLPAEVVRKTGWLILHKPSRTKRDDLHIGSGRDPATVGLLADVEEHALRNLGAVGDRNGCSNVCVHVRHHAIYSNLSGTLGNLFRVPAARGPAVVSKKVVDGHFDGVFYLTYILLSAAQFACYKDDQVLPGQVDVLGLSGFIQEFPPLS
ncbi:hypothetical protein DFH07DRAFT_782758 [Mycena maculata]|uniref:Uncharacterized protein n=1 Tax=Mycena maculata TaxID=230809 RepID=A0AAD7HR43_9AGAR|nr:hypothetical protein DFH07DRAFT_782758 [Mycena maculata]